ncbi:MAG: protein kinase [Verrucomicrobia bacterium]|nr:protein kinase [Verrucomicrobiota bacterium]
MDEEALYLAAHEIPDAGQRAAFLDQACGAGAALRARLDRLLAAEGPAARLWGDDPPPARADRTPVEAAPPAEGPGSVIGRYKLLEAIGEGGMGVVYLAEQEQPVRRRVALKVIKLGMDTKAVVARFEAERQALALMDHPNIAKVFDAGSTDTGRPYFVMELVRGLPITAYCDARRLSTRERLELFVPVCQAIQHAHQKGIIHRDIKPTNVLVASFDGRPVPMVIDFGVAKATNQRLTEKTLFTQFARMIGTPAYMSPEQAEGSQLDVDTRSDVYSLGVLLYELLTGSTPFPEPQLRRLGYAEMQRVIVREEPPRPSTRLTTLTNAERTELGRQRGEDPQTMSRLLRRELDWVVMKALEKDRTRRYATANGLAMDVQRHLEGRAVEAAPPTWGYQLQKLARKHRKTVGAAALLALVLAGAAVFSTWQAIRATQAEQLAEAQAAEAQTALAGETAAHADLEERIVLSARELLDGGQVGEGLALLADLVRRRPEDAVLGTWLANELAHRSFPRMALPALLHPDVVYDAQFSPDGRRLLTTCLDNAARVFDAATGHLLFPPLRHDPAAVMPGRYDRGLHAMRAAFDRTGARLATASCDTTARVWDALTGQPITPSLKHPDLVSFAVFSPDGAQLVTGCRDGRVRFWRLPEGALDERELRHNDWVNWAEFSPDGRLLVTASDDRTTRLWDVASGQPVGQPMRREDMVQYARFSPDGRRILAVGGMPPGRLWLTAGKEGEPVTAAVLPHADNMPFACFSPDGRWIGTASFDRTARVWSAHDGRPHTVLEHAGTVRMVQFSADGLRVATASEDGTVGLWEAPSGRRVMEPLRHGGKIWSARFSPAGDRLATASADGTVVIWDIHPGNAQPLVLVNDDKTVHAADWSSDGRWVTLSGTRHGLWNADDGTRAGDLHRWPLANASSVRFHPGQPALLIGTAEGFAEVWSVPDQRECVTRVFHGGDAVFAEWAADGRRFLTRAHDSLIRVWEHPGGREARLMVEASASVRAARFSPDGCWLVAGLANGMVQAWPVDGAADGLRWPAHERRITALAFSGEGSHLITASQDSRAAVWAFPEGRQVGAYLIHRGEVTDVALSADGRRALTASRDGTAQRWDAMQGTPLGAPLRHRGALTVARLDAANRQVVTGSEDGTARVWDFATGRPLTPPLRHLNRVRGAAFSPDGRKVLVASDGNPTIWTLFAPDGPKPPWLPELAAALAHPRPTVEGATGFRELGVPEDGETTPQAAWDEWRRWFHADRLDRSSAPGSAVTMSWLTARWLGDLDAIWDPVRARLLRRACKFAPGHSLGEAHLVAAELAAGQTSERMPSAEAVPALDRDKPRPLTSTRPGQKRCAGSQPAAAKPR